MDVNRYSPKQSVPCWRHAHGPGPTFRGVPVETAMQGWETRMSGVQGPQRPAEAAGSGRALFMACVSRAGPAVQVGIQTPKPWVIQSKV